MITSNELRPGVAIEMDGQVYLVLQSEHIKRGRGAAQVKVRLRNVRTGDTISHTFRAGEDVQEAQLDTRAMQYLYSSDDQYFFMDLETYDQIPISRELLGDALLYLKENAEVDVVMHEGRVVGVELPVTVDLQVVETSPGVRGDTQSGGSKPARLETGAVVQVPLFIEAGDVVRVDTRTGEYVTRVS